MDVVLPLLSAHLLGDFYLQSGCMATGKINDKKKLLLHSLIYFACVLICMGLFYDFITAVCISLIVGLSHLVIDLISTETKIKLHDHDKKDHYGRYVYLFDQAAHLTIIIIVVLVFINSNISTGGILSQSLINLPVEGMIFIMCLLIIGKPANITIKTLISIYKPVEDGIQEVPNTGGLIGILERLLMLIFMSMGQYAALGLVLTAKSIARYKRISEDKAFGEYFLLGTLLSVIMVVLPVLLLQYALIF